jgi:hypothetical protein
MPRLQKPGTATDFEQHVIQRPTQYNAFLIPTDGKQRMEQLQLYILVQGLK